MAANFIEPENLEDNLQEDEELSTFEEREDSTNVEQPEQDTEVDDVDGNVAEEDVPEKYKGKSTVEIIQMHKEAEKLLGKHSSEVGELRKIVDDFVKANLETAHNGGKEVEEELDFFDDPKKAVEAAIARDPALAEVRNLSKQMKEQAFMNKLNTEYPEHVELANDQGFVDWVTSSTIRQQLYQRAANEYDWESAEELLSNWKALSKAKQTAQETQKVDLKQERKKASTGSSKPSGESKSKKIYRRSDIINLMRTDPNRYAELSDEIMTAYSEGRVR